ncbi:MAG: phosphoribosylanthranilate isomerase [Planctomycetaceae bacterium]
MWVKICGINDVKTAEQVAALAPDAIGLNFYSGTPRVVSQDIAADIVRRLPAGVEPVGVFVNHDVADIIAICARCRLRTVQLHGDETPAQVAELQRQSAGLKIIRVHRLGPDGVAPLAEDLDKCRHLGVQFYACLVDARVEGVYGGSGRTIAWDAIAERRRGTHWPPLVLAGGLRPDNVAAAIAAVEPWGVDVAGGVESAPGVKDLSLVSAFIQSARSANDASAITWADGI